ncbi:MAG: alpha-galactosidase [Christensenellaceae bacterium]|nr:alpha-galactosidase [Christensenellaceae bacterium]
MDFKEGSFKIEYYVGDEKTKQTTFETEQLKVTCKISEGISLFIIPKTEIKLSNLSLEFKRVFKKESKFFANGYQSWTTSREYSMNDKEDRLTKIADILRPLKPLAAISGDYLFRHHSKKPGVITSYTYAYIREGSEIELIGSLSEKEGFTLITADMNQDTLTLSKDIDGLVIKEPTEIINVRIYKDNYENAFDRYVKEAGYKKPRINLLTGYTSWYNYFQKIDENIILRDLDGLDRCKEKVSIFQIDDGYETFVGDWLDKSEKFPRGMKYIADKIHDKGYLAGIWLAPFNVQRKSKTAKEHPDWLIKNKSGKPLLGCAGWGGAYTLDIYNPEVRQHIKNVFNVVLDDWKYDMVKLDFLYSQCMQPRNGKSRGAIMDYAMAFLRECVGDKLMLGCGVPLGSAFGYVDACRISCDVDLSFKGRYYNKLHINCEIPSAKNAITNTIFRRHLNNRFFVNDPDVFFLRDINLKFTQKQKHLLAKINNMFGNVLFISDDAGKYEDREISFLKKAFTKTETKVIIAEFVDKETIKITYTESESPMEKTLKFNIKTGETAGELL